MSKPTEIDEEPPVVPADGSLPLDRPWLWMERGWADFKRAPAIGLLYGMGFVGASWTLVTLLAIAGDIHMLLPLTGGFFILAPLLVAGLYETSRRLELGRPATVGGAFLAWRAPGQLALMGVVLLLIHLVWVRIALLLYPLFFHARAPTWETLIPQLLGTPTGIGLLITGGLIGGALAVLSFCVSAVSIPMLVDRDVSFAEAIVASLKVVARHPRTMLFWGAVIVVFTAMGLATMFFGLALVIPVVGHATWHAYRDTVPPAG
ncbi:MAG: DUF2189 domain-containing protein [Rhodospirillales bacterium]|nr:DUF2189 domain-containing protein [Rhodospirillales bacterium]